MKKAITALLAISLVLGVFLLTGCGTGGTDTTTGDLSDDVSEIITDISDALDMSDESSKVDEVETENEETSDTLAQAESKSNVAAE